VPVDSQQFAAAAIQAAERYEAGDVTTARDLFERIVDDSEVPDLDRSVIGVNLATVLTALGASEAEVEAAYDTAVELERRWMRGFAAESKAAWLVAVGRTWEARDLLLWLRSQPWTSFGDRDRFDGSVAALT